MSKENKILFYIKDSKDLSVWAIHEYDISDKKRLGWLNGKCVFVGNGHKNFIGADIGVDAQYVFTMDRYDVSKNLKSLL